MFSRGKLGIPYKRDPLDVTEQTSQDRQRKSFGPKLVKVG